MTGVIKKIVADKGFGFIKSDQGDIFFHIRDLAPGMNFNNMQEGEEVHFDVVSTEKGLKAVGVTY